MSTGGRFDFDDGGTYYGGWEDGKANGYGVCTGPDGQGEFAGVWHCGFELSGVYRWSSGNYYMGQWLQGKRNGLGTETKGRWIYEGEWAQDSKGRYGVRYSSATGAKYEGTWTSGLQDGYGIETYADGGTYQGQWQRGVRHGYGTRHSVPYGKLVRRCRLGGADSPVPGDSPDELHEHDRKVDEARGGFVLTGLRDDDITTYGKISSSAHGAGTSIRKTLAEKLRFQKRRSTGDMQEVNSRRANSGSVRSTVSNISQSSYGSVQSGASAFTSSNASFVSQYDLVDETVVETYSGDWKNDRRSGFGVCERTDGLRYAGEWENNRKHGYGMTTFKDGTTEEGKYKNNILVSSGKLSKLFILRTSKVRYRVENAVLAAQTSAQIARQKSDIAVSRMASAKAKADVAQQAAGKAYRDAEKARATSKLYVNEPNQYGLKPKKDDPSAVRPSSGGPSFLSKSKTSSRPPPSIASGLMFSTLDSTFIGGSAVGTKVKNSSGSDDDKPVGSRYAEPFAPLPPPPVARSTPREGVYAPKGLFGASSGISEDANQTPRTIQPTNATGSTPVGCHDLFAAVRRDNIGNAESTLPTFSYDTPRRLATKIDEERRSGTSPCDDPSFQNPPFQRRGTLPVRQNPLLSVPPSNNSTGGGVSSTSKTDLPEVPRTTQSSFANPRSVIRSPPTSLPAALPSPPSSRPSVGRHMPSVSRPSPAAAGLRKSTSTLDVSATTHRQSNAMMPREEVHMLSQLRREEIRRQREETERRRQQEIVLSLSGIKEWCLQKQLLMLVIAINISLATMFFNLLQ